MNYVLGIGCRKHCLQLDFFNKISSDGSFPISEDYQHDFLN